jgi:hypothetical protein
MCLTLFHPLVFEDLQQYPMGKVPSGIGEDCIHYNTCPVLEQITWMPGRTNPLAANPSGFGVGMSID